MFLATDIATAAVEGQQIVLTVPSGKQQVEIALTPNQAIHLSQSLLRAATDQIEPRGNAAVIDFERRRA